MTSFPDLAEKVVARKMKYIQKYIDTRLAEMSVMANPEKLLGKKYEDWTELDHQLMLRVYGPKNPVLNNLVFDREYRDLRKGEGEVA